MSVRIATPLEVGHFRECVINRSPGFQWLRWEPCNCRELSAPGGLFERRNRQREAEARERRN